MANNLPVNRARDWSRAEDGQPALSRLDRHWDQQEIIWTLEVRSESEGVGTRRLGHLVLRGSPNGDLEISLTDAE